ncbi:MAG: aminotransferase class III-fold pyridoxal phosphate-dependent enzyme [Bacteroidales bacterium]
MSRPRRLLTSRAFYSNILGVYEKYITEYFGYDKVLPMNSGAEADETALKLCRKWAYKVKGIEDGKAKIIVCEGNFHGRTITIISMSTDPDSYGGFGPATPGLFTVPYNDLAALEAALADPDVAGFLVEPIQGEAGVFVPDEGYLAKAYELCKKNNVLFIADEVQTGIARTGKLLCDHENVRPDILILGKALSGRLCRYLRGNTGRRRELCSPLNKANMDQPLLVTMAGRVAIAALEVVKKKNWLKKLNTLGKYSARLSSVKSEMIELVRGKGVAECRGDPGPKMASKRGMSV